MFALGCPHALKFEPRLVDALVDEFVAQTVARRRVVEITRTAQD
jgi:hypothetical protein